MSAGYAYAALAAFQIYQGIEQARFIQKNAALTRQINQLNAKYTEMDAYEAEKYGYTQQARYQTQIDQTVSEQRVAYASQGVDVSFGTAAEIQNETKVTGFLNMLDIQKQARANALGLKRQASNIRLQGSMADSQSSMNASATRAAGILGAAQTGVTGYANYKKGTINADSNSAS